MRRRLMVSALVAVPAWARVAGAFAQARGSFHAFMQRAFEMKRQAITAGDQPYGAVVVKDGMLIAESPSRVVTSMQADAHAEREAIRMAQALTGTRNLAGAVLLSTSRPCSLCERAAFEAHIVRMIYGEHLIDAGPPRI